MTALPFPSDIPCPRCAARPGEKCVTDTGVTRMPHRARQDRLRSRLRRGEKFVVVVRRPDETIPVAVGERCVASASDPSRVTLLARVGGARMFGSMPVPSADFVRWISDAEFARVTA